MDSFAPAPLFVSLIIGAVGLGLFLYGKRQKRLPQMFAGLVLMAFPYFVPSVLWMVAIAVVIVGLTWMAARVGL